MEYFTNLIGKQVLSIYDNEIIGTVLNIQFDTNFRRATILVILSKEEDSILLLPAQKVYSINSVITIRNKNDLVISAEPQTQTVINSLAYGVSGKCYGKILEIGIEKWQVQLLYADITIDISKVLCTKNGLILVNDIDKKIHLHHFIPKTATIKIESTQLVEPMTTIPQSTVDMPKTIIATKPLS